MHRIGRIGWLLLLVASPGWAGWRHECRVQTHQCRVHHGITTTTSTTTTTVIPYSNCHSGNCGGQCIQVGGETWVRETDALSGRCSLPTLPCSTTTTTLAESISGAFSCPSENCAAGCIVVNGEYWVRFADALSGRCSLPQR